MKAAGRGGSRARNGKMDQVREQGGEMELISDAEIMAVELHPKRAGMYRVWVRTNGSVETNDPFDEPQDLQGEQSHSKPEQAEDWHAEVDSWLQEAADVKTRASEEFAVTVHEDTLVTMRLLKGKRLTTEEWQQLRREEALEDAYRAALSIIERKARTSRELANALKRKGYSAVAIDGCLQRLQSRKLLDDSAYARRFAEQRTIGQRKGSRLVRQELVQRGISKEEADRALGQLDESLEIEAAFALARKKWPQLKGELRERRMKLTAFLMRRGYPGSIARKALEQVLSESVMEEDENRRYHLDGENVNGDDLDWEESE